MVTTDDPSLLLPPESAEGFPGNPIAGRPPVRPDCRVLQFLPSGGGGRGPGTDDAGRRRDPGSRFILEDRRYVGNPGGAVEI